MLNLLSLFLGLLSWGLGFAAIAGKGQPAAIFSSMAACAASLLLQLRELQLRVGFGDMAAVEDTIDVVVFSGIVLLTVTAVLNLAALLRRR